MTSSLATALSDTPKLSIISEAFRTALHTSGLPQQTVARRGHILPGDISRYLRGTPFGPRTRQRIEAIGATLDLPAEACTEPFVDPVFCDNGPRS